MNLRTFLRFWADDRPAIACCLFASDDDLETEGDLFDCQSCAVADALDSLAPENHAAWVLMRRLMTRFTSDCGCVSVVLTRALERVAPEDVDDLLDRVALIYDELYPPLSPPPA